MTSYYWRCVRQSIISGFQRRGKDEYLKSDRKFEFMNKILWIKNWNQNEIFYSGNLIHGNISFY